MSLNVPMADVERRMHMMHEELRKLTHVTGNLDDAFRLLMFREIAFLSLAFESLGKKLDAPKPADEPKEPELIKL